MDILIEESFGFLAKFTGDHHCDRVAVARFVFQRLGNLDDHFGHWMLDDNIVEDDDAVVGDHDIAHVVDEHLVHALRSEGGTDGFRDSLASTDGPSIGCLLPACAHVPRSIRGLAGPRLFLIGFFSHGWHS